MARKNRGGSMKPRKGPGAARAKSKGKPSGKHGPSKPGNRAAGRGGPGLSHESYMTP